MHKIKITFLIPFVLFFVFFIILLSGCMKDDSEDEIKKYSAVTTGYGGDVTVEIGITANGKIGTILVKAPDESPDKGGIAADKIAKEIITKQSLAVDGVTGATITSTAVLSATETALKQAGIDTEALK